MDSNIEKKLAQFYPLIEASVIRTADADLPSQTTLHGQEISRRLKIEGVGGDCHVYFNEHINAINGMGDDTLSAIFVGYANSNDGRNHLKTLR